MYLTLTPGTRLISRRLLVLKGKGVGGWSRNYDLAAFTNASTPLPAVIGLSSRSFIGPFGKVPTEVSLEEARVSIGQLLPNFSHMSIILAIHVSGNGQRLLEERFCLSILTYFIIELGQVAPDMKGIEKVRLEGYPIVGDTLIFSRFLGCILLHLVSNLVSNVF